MIEKVLISGYTKRESKGIYSVDLDTDKGELSNLQLVAEASGSTYIALDSQNHLCAVSSVNGEGGTSSFQFNGQTATHLNDVTAPGASNCYVSVDEARGLVYAANYHLGQVRVYKQGADGALTLVETLEQPDHHGPKPEQKGSL